MVHPSPWPDIIYDHVAMQIDGDGDITGIGVARFLGVFLDDASPELNQDTIGRHI